LDQAILSERIVVERSKKNQPDQSDTECFSRNGLELQLILIGHQTTSK